VVREMTRRSNNNSVPPVLNITTKKVRGFAAKAAVFCALALSVGIVHARDISGIRFPEVVSVAGR
jgi:hypothetical protein